MKHAITLLMVLAFSSYLAAQPKTITWQGKLLDASGNAITQNNVAMTFAMFDASSEGNQLWPASGVVTKTVDVAQGLYSVQLGTGVGDDIAFTVAMLDGKTPWLEVKVGMEILPRTEITNVPFALISNELSAVGWENPGEIGKTTPNLGKFTSVETGSIKVTTGAASGKVLTSDADGNAAWVSPQYQEPGTAAGQMQYWNGTEWVTVAAGQNGQILRFVDGIPMWMNEDLINSLNIGDYYRGGFIAYFLQAGDPGYDPNTRHGIIVAPTDQGNYETWGCVGNEITGADGTVLGTGAQNTLDIVAGCSEAGIAAHLCNDLVLNGYSDWYLPSIDELEKVFWAKDAIGGFADYDYWSSSESGSDNAWKWSFLYGYEYTNGKNYEFRVRAIRSF